MLRRAFLSWHVPFRSRLQNIWAKLGSGLGAVAGHCKEPEDHTAPKKGKPPLHAPRW